MRASNLAVLALCVHATAVTVATPANAEQLSDEKAKSFIDGVATIVLKAAWPSATYKSYNFEEVRFVGDGRYDVVFRIDATSVLDNDIWLEAIVRVDDNLRILDLRWGDRKPGTLEPGTVVKVLGQVIENYNRKRQNYDNIAVRNYCDSSIYVAIRYLDLNNEWVTKGWYDFVPNEEAVIAKTRNTIYYYYAMYKGKAGGTRDGTLQFEVRDTVRSFRKSTIATKNWGTWVHGEYCFGWSE